MRSVAVSLKQCWIQAVFLLWLTGMGSGAGCQNVEMKKLKGEDTMRIIRDIPYYRQEDRIGGDQEYARERCLLDMAVPVGKKDFPTLILFHGGGLSNGSKAIPETLLTGDFAIVAPNYRLSSARAKCPDYLEDAAAATAWVLRNIRQSGGDSHGVYVGGVSGGGYLAAMVGMNGKYLQRHGFTISDLAGIITISAQLSTHFQILNEREGVTGMRTFHIVVDEFAPLFHLSSETPPVVLYTGDCSVDVPGRAEENAYMAAVLKRSLRKKHAEHISLSEFGHYDLGVAAFPLVAQKIAVLESERRLRDTRTPVLCAGSAGNPGDEAALKTSFGLPYYPKSLISAEVSGGKLFLRIFCEEPRMNLLKLEKSIWKGDCAEIFVELPQAESDSAVLQWCVAPDGKNIFAVHFSSRDRKIYAKDVKINCSEKKNGWSVELEIPLRNLAVTRNTGELRVNFIRRRAAGGEHSFACFSPNGKEFGIDVENFGILRLPAPGTE